MELLLSKSNLRKRLLKFNPDIFLLPEEYDNALTGICSADTPVAVYYAPLLPDSPDSPSHPSVQRLVDEFPSETASIVLMFVVQKQRKESQDV